MCHTEILRSVYNKRQRPVCDITPNKMQCSGTTLQWCSRMGLQPFSSVPIDFNESRIAIVIAALTLTLGVNGPLCSTIWQDKIRKFQLLFTRTKVVIKHNPVNIRQNSKPFWSSLSHRTFEMKYYVLHCWKQWRIYGGARVYMPHPLHYRPIFLNKIFPQKKLQNVGLVSL